MGLRLLGRCIRGIRWRGPSAVLRSGSCTSSRPRARTAHCAIAHLVSAPPSAGMVWGRLLRSAPVCWANLARIWRMFAGRLEARGPYRAPGWSVGTVCCLGAQLFVDVVFTFDSTHVAMAADKALAGAGVAFTMIPTPTAISAGCGISLRLSYGLLEQARSVLAAQTPPIVSAAHGLDEAGAYTPL